jgi:hypothetical protein
MVTKGYRKGVYERVTIGIIADGDGCSCLETLAYSPDCHPEKAASPDRRILYRAVEQAFKPASNPTSLEPGL